MTSAKRLAVVALTTVCVGPLAVFAVARGCVALDAGRIDVGDSVSVYDPEVDAPTGGYLVREVHDDGTVTVGNVYEELRVQRSELRAVNALNVD